MNAHICRLEIGSLVCTDGKKTKIMKEEMFLIECWLVGLLVASLVVFMI